MKEPGSTPGGIFILFLYESEYLGGILPSFPVKDGDILPHSLLDANE
jgi:hypothetical protein